jgi:uncharacterized protein YjiS (DUF1127 family)
MTTRFEMTAPDALVECRTTKDGAAKLPPAIASLWTKYRSAWMDRLARRRLQRSIAHLDERLLADIGLDAEDLGFAERLARRRAASHREYWPLV